MRGTYTFPVSKALVGDILTLENDVPPSKKDIEGFSHLEGIEFDELPSKEIGILLSSEFAWSWMGGEVRRGTPREPVAYLTCYGWTTIGCNRSSTSDAISHYRIDADDLDIRNDINKVFGRDFEDIAVNKKCPSVSDLHAMKQLQETSRFDKELGHWVVGLPHKTSREDTARILNSVDSSTPSRNRLIKSRERLRRDPELKEKVVKQMNALIGEFLRDFFEDLIRDTIIMM